MKIKNYFYLLSKFIWKLKDDNIEFNIKWKMVSFAKSYKISNKGYDSCTILIARKNFK